MLFIPWYAMTFAEFRGDGYALPDIMDVLMKKALYGCIIIYFCQIIIMLFFDQIKRDTIWKKLYLKEILTVFAICACEYILIYAFVVMRGTVSTVILTTVSFLNALLGWMISLIFLSPLLYLFRK